MQKNNLPAIAYQLDFIYEYYFYIKALEKFQKEQEFKDFCLDVMEQELEKELEFYN